MSIGHGAPGLRDKLRTFHDLMLDPHAERRAYLDLRLGKTINDSGSSVWTLDAGSIYRTSITASSVTFAGVIRAIVAVQSMAGTRDLTRVERTADMVAGTWYYDDAALVSGGSTNLYVWLSTSADPDTTTIVAHLLFTFADTAEVHPLFGPEKYANNDLETWSGGNPSSWTEVGAGVTQETSIVLSGSSSARIGTTVNATTLDGIQQSLVGVQYGTYRLSGYYQTPLTGMSSDVEVRLRVGDGTNYMNSDGRTSTTAVTTGFAIGQTYGEWKRFVFDFIWPAATTAALVTGAFLYNTAGAVRSATVYLDRMSCRRIFRWTLYDARLTSSSIPETEIRSADNLFGPKSYTIGSIAVSDGEGDLAEAFYQLLLFRKPAKVSIGGRFPNGAEVYADDWRGAFMGLTVRPEITDSAITFDLDDARTLTAVTATPNAYRVADLSSMDTASEGKPKVHVFGETESYYLKPVRVSTNGNGYGAYEYLDPTVPVADNVNIDTPTGYSLKSYPNHELADRDEKGYVINDFTNDITLSNNNTRWQIIRDVRNLRYDRSGTEVGRKLELQFDITSGLGAPVMAAISLLEGPPYTCAATIQTALRTAVGGGDTTMLCTYSESTHKFTISRTGALTVILMPTGTDRSGYSYKLLGFDPRTNTADANSHTAPDAIFSDADEDHIIRIRSGGYRDDSSGSICGTANVALNTPPAAASWLLQKVLKVPAANVDVSGTFASGRDTSSTEFGFIFKVIEAGRVLEALTELEQASVANLVVDGDGVWKWKRHVASSSGAREFYDRDYLSWRMWLDSSLIHKQVRLYGDYNQSQGRSMTYGDASGVIDTGIPIKHGTEAVLEVQADLEREYITGGTQLISNYFGRLVGKTPRCVEFSARGRLTDLLVGDKIKLTRARAFDSTGAISSLAFRITALRHNFITGISTCTAVEDVTFLS